MAVNKEELKEAQEVIDDALKGDVPLEPLKPEFPKEDSKENQ